MNREVRAAIRKYQMLRQGDRVFVAVSGGADSVALLHVLKGLCRELEVRLHALHLNHNLRGEESVRDEDFVSALCGLWGIPLTVASVRVGELAARRGLSVEECARQERYRFFHSVARGEGTKIATAHTRSDTVETVLLNLVRGTALRGLAGIPPVRGNVVRPLIACTRRQVEAYCETHGLAYVTDSTNLQEDYTRNLLRLRIIPALSRLNPRLEERVGDMADILRTDANYLDSLAGAALERLELGGGRYSTPGFLAQPDALRPRILTALLLQNGQRYGRERLRAMEAQIRQGSGAVRLACGLELRCKKEVFSLDAPLGKRHRMPAIPDTMTQIQVPAPGEAAEGSICAGKKLVLRTFDYKNFEKTINNQKKLLKNALDCDRIEKIVKLRYCKPSDTIRQPGRGCTKTLKKLWAEAQIPPERRREKLALSDDKGLLWAEDFGVREDCAPNPSTLYVMTVEVMEE